MDTDEKCVMDPPPESQRFGAHSNGANLLEKKIGKLLPVDSNGMYTSVLEF